MLIAKSINCYSTGNIPGLQIQLSSLWDAGKALQVSEDCKYCM